jgi:hypothetical protein
LVLLPGGQVYPGFPDWGGMMDTDPAGGRLLGLNGTIYFLVEDGLVRHLARTVSSLWGRFTPDGNVLLADERSVRLVAPDGQDLKRVDIAGAVVNGILSPDGQEAVLLVHADGKAGLQRLSLAGWTATAWQALDRPVESYGQLNWVAGQQQVKVLSQQGAPWLLDLTTGETRDVSGTPLISSPDGRWVVDPDIGAIIGTDGRSVPLSAGMQAAKYPYALWAPDSRHVLLPGGQVIDMETGSEFAQIKGMECAAPQMLQLGKVGSELVAAYSVGCY